VTVSRLEVEGRPSPPERLEHAVACGLRGDRPATAAAGTVGHHDQDAIVEPLHHQPVFAATASHQPACHAAHGPPNEFDRRQLKSIRRPILWRIGNFYGIAGKDGRP
jgi:hypothetical protein